MHQSKQLEKSAHWLQPLHIFLSINDEAAKTSQKIRPYVNWRVDRTLAAIGIIIHWTGNKKYFWGIEQSCSACQIYAQKQCQLKFTFCDDKNVNNPVYAYMFYVNSKPTLHILDKATNYQSERWLADMTYEKLRKTLRECWIEIYLGQPDVIVHGADKTFMATSFQADKDMLQIDTKSVFVEPMNNMSNVGRHHGPMISKNNTIAEEVPDIWRQEVLELTLKDITDPVSPGGLVLILFVFGAIFGLELLDFLLMVPLQQPSNKRWHFARRQEKLRICLYQDRFVEHWIPEMV